MHGLNYLVPMLLKDLFLRTKEIVFGRLGRQLIVNLETGFGIQEESREGSLVCRFRETGCDGGGDTVVGVAGACIREILNVHVDDVCREGHVQRGGNGDQMERITTVFIYHLRRLLDQ